MITLYHGSYIQVETPLVKLGRKKVDFGQGFYLTKLRQQASSWAKTIAERKGRNNIPTLSIYSFDYDTVEDYENNIITAEQAFGQLKYKAVNHQICILSQDIVDNYLSFISSEQIEQED